MRAVKIPDQSVYRQRMLSIAETVKAALIGGPVEVVIRRPKRSLDQNAKMWAMLTDVSKQVDWYGEMLSKDDWKNIFSAVLRKQRAVPGIDGGFVVLGLSTKGLEKKEFSDLIEIIYAFGSEHHVSWSEPAMRAYEMWGEA